MEQIEDSRSPYAARPRLSVFKKIHVTKGIEHNHHAGRSGRRPSTSPRCTTEKPSRQIVLPADSSEAQETASAHSSLTMAHSALASAKTATMNDQPKPTACRAQRTLQSKPRTESHRKSRYHRRTLNLPQLQAVGSSTTNGRHHAHDLNVDDLPRIRKQVNDAKKQFFEKQYHASVSQFAQQWQAAKHTVASPRLKLRLREAFSAYAGVSVKPSHFSHCPPP